MAQSTNIKWGYASFIVLLICSALPAAAQEGSSKTGTALGSLGLGAYAHRPLE